MRGYSKIAPQFWIGPTGKRIRQLGPEAQVVAMYLLTSPHANMIGLYHLPVAYMAADTGLHIEGASKALRSLTEAGFCAYDDAAEVVWVFEMARFQVAESLAANDKQCKGVWNEYREVPSNCYLADFYERYTAAFHLPEKRLGTAFEAPSQPPGEDPSEGLRSHEQEQEQEQTLVPDGTCRIGVRPEEFANVWNQLRGPLPGVREFTESRRRKVRTRMAQGVTLAKWEEAVKHCVSTPFLVGNNQQGWQASFDWLVENDTNIAKVLEGKYDHGGNGGNGATRPIRTRTDGNLDAAREAL